MQVTRFLCNYDSGDAKGVRACTDGVSIFLTGGELSYGRGQWLRKAWTYNSLTDHWAVLNDVDGAEIEVESPRRHHSTCILDQKVRYLGVGFWESIQLLESIPKWIRFQFQFQKKRNRNTSNLYSISTDIHGRRVWS